MVRRIYVKGQKPKWVITGSQVGMIAGEPYIPS